MKKNVWFIACIVVAILIGAVAYLNLPRAEKQCSEYTVREECAKDIRCEWPGPSCAVPGKNCGFAYDPNKDKCLPKDTQE
jgi:hypothetical protein